jgi:GNAT superfamily N-acetyltransferase
VRLHFQPIDVTRHFDLCVQFRVDTQIASFGSEERFWKMAGEGAAQYRAWLVDRIGKSPEGCVHAFEGSAIVGQIEMGLDREVADAGYVNLFYLVPEARGRGLADELVAYAVRYARKLGCNRLRLTVSRANERALAVYRRWGFVDLGPRADEPAVNLMEKPIARVGLPNLG